MQNGFWKGWGMHGFGQRLRGLRESLKVTQDELAEKVGLTPTAISKIENGAQSVKIHHAEAMATALGVDIFTLLGEAPASPHFATLYRALQSRPLQTREDYVALLRIMADEIERLAV